MTLSRRSALTLLAVAGVSGCSFEPITWTSASPEPSETNTVDPAVELDPEYMSQSLDGSPKTIEEGFTVGQRVSTPHFDGTIEAAFVGARLGERSAAQVSQQTAVRAAPEHELVAFTLRAGDPVFTGQPEEPPTFALQVGERRVTLEHPFGRLTTAGRYETQWVFIVLSVPVAAPVRFQVSDQGRTCSIDLREGRAIEDEGWAANALFRERQVVTLEPTEATFSRGVDVVLPEGTESTGQTAVELIVTMAPLPSRGLTPWVPGLGWAEAGTLWLPLQTQSKVAFSPVTNTYLITVDVPQSFVYQDEGGSLINAVSPETITTQQIMRGQSPLDVVWAVPEGDTRGVVRFNPVGTLEANFQGGVQYPASFTGTAIPMEFTLEIAPLEE